jgi:hypothetical protein
MTCLLVLGWACPFQRPSVTVFAEVIARRLQALEQGGSAGPWFAPWQRSQAAARQVRKP